MWAAKCSYVRNLYEPRKYGDALEKMYNDTVLHPILGNTTYACMQPDYWSPSHTGRGRHAMERWAYSHPDVRPVSSINGKKIPKVPYDFTPSLANVPFTDRQRIGFNTRSFSTAFARLEGRLFEWKHIYGRVPNQDSWIYEYYGHRYAKGVESHYEKCNALANRTRAALADQGITVPS